MSKKKKKHKKGMSLEKKLIKQESNRIKEDITKDLEERVAHSAYDKGYEDACDKATILLLALPLFVLKDRFWQKTYKRKFPDFVEGMFRYYERWLKEEITSEDIAEIFAENKITVEVIDE